jgi:TetR/AcrR family transcriptional regulator, transcriptional repressor for nem operon
VAGTSLDDVRERASVSKGQLYHYFVDREDLVRAVARSTCDTVLARQADALAQFDCLAGIERYLDAVVALQRERHARGGCPIGSLAGQLAEHDERARLALADGLGRWEDAMRAGLGAMAERGLLRADVDPARLAVQVLATIQGGLLLTQVRRDPGQIRVAADGVLSLVRAAMTAESREESHGEPG